MPKFVVGYKFTAWTEKEIEAENEEDALRILEESTNGPLDDWFDGHIEIQSCWTFVDPCPR